MVKVKKVVLAYSGGLDTSVILRWLQEQYECEVITFTADIGQGEEIEPARKRAKEMGINKIYIEDLREEFVKDYVFPMFRAGAIYEGTYLLGTAIARPLIAKRQIEIAAETGADSVSHGATGKGNDQVRFELGYLSLNPNINIIAPWREWDLDSRTKLIEWAEKRNISVPVDKRGEPPYSTDANLLHISYEGKALEDPWIGPDEDMFTRTVSPLLAPNEPEEIIIGFESGNPISLNGKVYSPAKLLESLNEKAGKHGIGRIDIVENRFVGMKSRGVYETPGGSILYIAHRGLEQLVLDGPTMQLRDELIPKYASLIYNGFWFSPEREMLQELVDNCQRNVTGDVKLNLYKGCCSLMGRRSPKSIYNEGIVTFEAGKNYDQKDAEGFINLNSIRLKQRNKNKT
tara:strand:+ start:9902 stop:11107 length:1206 start_codon:yes stop_codon:yes gene_type:complete